ncbi:hypothetical protein [Haloferula sp.]|uniref:hypothetical protein n=1 Tax=Haloferula sp. TaxID=2497595 RepID=UPI003C76A89F
MKTRPLLASITLLTLAATSEAILISGYSSANHDRFTGFPSNPVINSSSFFDGTKLRGLGWDAVDTRKQFTLVTRSHVLFATHFLPPVGQEIRFLNDSNQIVSRNVASTTIVQNVDDDPATPNTDSDLALVTLDEPIDSIDGVAPFPYLDLPLLPPLPDPNEEGEFLPFSEYRNYLDLDLIVFGRLVRAGRATVDEIVAVSGSGLNPTVTMSFDYDLANPAPDDSRLEGGDSGSPTFHLASGKMNLISHHSAIGTEGSIQSNVGSFVPHYVDQLDLLLAPSGYRMTPANTATTTLAVTDLVVTSTPRKGNPLVITLTLENTGADPTGNLEVDFQFASGEEPDGISGSDWVDYGGGSNWTVRRALLDSAEITTLTLSWASAPLVGNLAIGIDWRSDKAASGSLSPSYALGSSFNEWAAGLSEPGQLDNPDDDEFFNLSEYAFGGNPENSINQLPNGEPARPVISVSGTTAMLTFPERSDALSRGLSYAPQWAFDLAPEAWSATHPAGLTSTASPYDPAVPGFVKRTLTWPADEAWQFARVGISLDE